MEGSSLPGFAFLANRCLFGAAGATAVNAEAAGGAARLTGALAVRSLFGATCATAANAEADGGAARPTGALAARGGVNPPTVAVPTSTSSRPKSHVLDKGILVFSFTSEVQRKTEMFLRWK